MGLTATSLAAGPVPAVAGLSERRGSDIASLIPSELHASFANLVGE